MYSKEKCGRRRQLSKAMALTLGLVRRGVNSREQKIPFPKCQAVIFLFFQRLPWAGLGPKELILSFIINFLAVEPMLTDRRSEMANSGDGQTTLPYSTVLYYCAVLQVLVHSFSVSSDDLALYISRVE
jgi:hypothetical protein